MKNILASPFRSLILGLVISAIAVALWLVAEGADWRGFLSFLVRWLHVLAAMIWVGMIFFVNFIQLVALAEAEPQSRPVILKHVVPRVATMFRHASHLVVVSGIVLLVTSGYMLDRLMFTAPVYIPPVRNLMLWAGIAAALVMYGLVHFRIWPDLRIVLGQVPSNTDGVAAARERVAASARWNFVLAIPVSVAMVAAAHLY